MLATSADNATKSRDCRERQIIKITGGIDGNTVILGRSLRMKLHVSALIWYLVVVPMYDREGRFLSQVFRDWTIMEERLCALPGANLSDAGDVQPSPVPVLLRRLPAQAAEVRVQGVETAVNPGIGPDLLQFTPALHERQAVCCAAHLGKKMNNNFMICFKLQKHNNTSSFNCFFNHVSL